MASTRSAPVAYSRNVGVSRTAKSQRFSDQLPTLNACYNTLDIPKGMPRRYEEMKSDVIKDFSHKRILSIGLDVHHRMKQAAEQTQEQAVREAEAKVADRAGRERNEALEALTNSLNRDYELRIAKLKKEHQKTLQERVLEVETLLANETLEAVELEREEAQARLEAAVEEVEIQMRKEMEQLAEKVRAEEQLRHKSALDSIAKNHKIEIQNMRQQMGADHKKNIAKLRNQFQEAMEDAVLAEKLKEQKIASEALHLQRSRYEKTIDGHLERLKKEIAQANSLQQLFDEEKEARAAVEEEILQIGKEFSDFVHRAMGVQRGEAEYLLPTSPLVTNILASRNLLNRESRVQRWISRANSIETISIGDPIAKKMLRPAKDFKIDSEFV